MQPESAILEAAVAEMRDPEYALAAALSILGIPERWNYLCVCDGSGSSWQRACGWGALLVIQQPASTIVFRGGLSHGTVNIGELMACVHPLSWLINRPEFDLAHNRVCVATDSEWLVKCGTRQQARTANTEWWAMFDTLVRKGLNISFHWIPRDIWAPHIFVDGLSKKARQAIEPNQEEVA